MCIRAKGVEGYYVSFKAMFRDGVSDAFPFFLQLALFITNRISWSIIFILNLFCRVPKGRHLEFCHHRKYIGTKAQQSHKWWWKWELWIQTSLLIKHVCVRYSPTEAANIKIISILSIALQDSKRGHLEFLDSSPQVMKFSIWNKP